MSARVSPGEGAAHLVLNSAWTPDVGEELYGEAAVAKLEKRLATASADIRNALVPLQTIAELLQRNPDQKTQGWCSWMLRREVRHIVSILEELAR
jgi:hypothetical protein